ncbi:hypothetical protein [Methanosphaera sp. WGK6]|uniref:hypothetical protein n=1 Tax=Methanosphaera sp. WGK6 TaxID=1561964 RepID=UPI00084CE03B|nr:hypothetical protein [Methanosphaera sp. WGK6]OED29634.1 hypothetical protein NL43_07185 [Methanosphaera sp. WGK6]
MANPIVAAILSFFSGIGNLYLGLYKRFIVTCVIAIILFSTGVLMPLGLLFCLYYAYDSYIVANAMNENKEIPKLFTVLDIQ